MTLLRTLNSKGPHALLAALLLGGIAGSPAAARPARALQDYCWTVKTTICTDCAESDSKYCDPRTSEGPYVTCVQSLTKPCTGFTCSAIDAKTVLYAIGDIASYPGKLKLILCGFSEAAMAAHGAYPLVHPNEALHFEYSTTKGVPGAA